MDVPAGSKHLCIQCQRKTRKTVLCYVLLATFNVSAHFGVRPPAWLGTDLMLG
jgi:hypothetical protein